MRGRVLSACALHLCSTTSDMGKLSLHHSLSRRAGYVSLFFWISSSVSNSTAAIDLFAVVVFCLIFRLDFVAAFVLFWLLHFPF